MTISKQRFTKFLLISVVLLFVSIYYLTTTYKLKREFHNITGSVEWVSMKYGDLPQRDFSKYRYLKIDNFSRPFELFVGKEGGDFSPALDKIDSLKSGDEVTIYYDENFRTVLEPVNRLPYFIDRGANPVFIFSPSQRHLAWIMVGLSIACLTLVIVFRPKTANRSASEKNNPAKISNL